MDLVELSDIGITKDVLLNLANHLSFSMSQMATLLSMTERTIQRHRPGESFRT